MHRISAAFDADNDGLLSADELKIDSPAREEVVKSKLTSLGLGNPRIEGLTQPYRINHNVTRRENAVNACTACHNANSRVSQTIKLSEYAPNGTLPAFDTANNVNASGEIVTGEGGGHSAFSCNS